LPSLWPDGGGHNRSWPALERQTGLSPQQQHSVLRRLKRFGVNAETIWLRYAASNGRQIAKQQFFLDLRLIDQDQRLVTYTSLYIHLLDQFLWGLLSWEGENAAGKSTLLKLIAGILKPGRGRLTVLGEDTRRSTPASMARKIGYLSQNPNDYLFEDTVEDELRFTLNNLGREDQGMVDRVLEKLDLSGVRGANPRDLSGGERQRVAMASVLVAGPELLLLDEPTRGIDYKLKNELGTLLREQNEQGLTTVLVTHDVEFAAEYARQVAVMFDGRIVAAGSKYQILTGSAFYSPQIARLFYGIAGDVLTVGDAVEKIRLIGGVAPKSG
jgi:energy-coupling factor transporter ATP-binding protein EcfA2